MTTSANPTLTQIEQNFLNLVLIPFLSAWFAATSFFSTPVIGAVSSWAIKTVVQLVYKYVFVQLVDVASIKLSNAAAQSTYEEQSELLTAAAEENGIRSPQYVQAQTAALAAMAAFTAISQ